MTREESETLDIRPAGGGSLMSLRVRPGAARTLLVGAHGGALKLSVKEPPERGRANAAVIRLMAELLGISRDALEITAGAGARHKSLAISGLSPGEVRSRLVTE